MICGFPPIARKDARALVLGSMPGEASLTANQYYGHPRNSFWLIMSAITGIPADAPYENRTRGLQDAGIALWDVISSCRRRGSLDSSIEAETIACNDFNGFFTGHPYIRLVIFNGATAEKEYRRRVLPGLGPELSAVEYRRLPSTSPAMASLSAAQKQLLWEEALC